MAKEAGMFTRMKTVASVALAVSVLVLSGCATLGGNSRSGNTPDLPSRTFFGHLVYTMENPEVVVGMEKMEALLEERYPEDLLDGGRMFEEHVAGMYKEASRGDRHITWEEFEMYRGEVMRAVERELPNSLRSLRRRR